MTRVNFFTELFLVLEDKASINLTVQRTGDELTVLLVPKINGKTTMVAMSGTAEELDDEFFTELNKPVEKIKGLVSNAEEAVIEDFEEEDESEDNDDKKAAPKKSAPKKSAAKKASKSSKDKKEENVAGKEENPETENSTSEDEDLAKDEESDAAAIEAERLKEEAAAQAEEKAEAERLAKEKAAEVKQAFDDELKAGDEAFKGREFLKAQKHFQAAVDLFPEDEKAKAELSKATKWVNQLREAGLLKEEEEGGNDGANS